MLSVKQGAQKFRSGKNYFPTGHSDILAWNLPSLFIRSRISLWFISLHNTKVETHITDWSKHKPDTDGQKNVSTTNQILQSESTSSRFAKKGTSYWWDPCWILGLTSTGRTTSVNCPVLTVLH